MVIKLCIIKILTKLKHLKGRDFEKVKKSYKKFLFTKKTPFLTKKSTPNIIFHIFNSNKKNFTVNKKCTLETLKSF